MYTYTQTPRHVHLDKTQAHVCGTAWRIALTPERQAERLHAVSNCATAPCSPNPVKMEGGIGTTVSQESTLVTAGLGEEPFPPTPPSPDCASLHSCCSWGSVLVVYLPPGMDCMVPCKLS